MEEALKGTLRLKAIKWKLDPDGYGQYLDMIINTIPLSKEDQDSMTTTYNLDHNFVVDIPTKKYYKEVGLFNHIINCQTEGSKLDDNRTGAGVLINDT